MKGRYQHVATKASEAASYIRPEIMAIPEKTMAKFLKAKELGEWKLALGQLLRYRPYTLGKKEEQLLAMQGTMSQASNQIFRQLNDADLKWGFIRDDKGKLVELGHSSFSMFLQSPDRTVRKNAFDEYYKQFDAQQEHHRGRRWMRRCSGMFITPRRAAMRARSRRRCFRTKCR